MKEHQIANDSKSMDGGASSYCLWYALSLSLLYFLPPFNQVKWRYTLHLRSQPKSGLPMPCSHARKTNGSHTRTSNARAFACWMKTWPTTSRYQMFPLSPVKYEHIHQSYTQPPTQRHLRQTGHHDIAYKRHIVLKSVQPCRHTWSTLLQNWTMPGDTGPNTWPILGHAGYQQCCTFVDASKHLPSLKEYDNWEALLPKPTPPSRHLLQRRIQDAFWCSNVTLQGNRAMHQPPIICTMCSPTKTTLILLSLKRQTLQRWWLEAPSLQPSRNWLQTQSTNSAPTRLR